MNFPSSSWVGFNECFLTFTPSRSQLLSDPKEKPELRVELSMFGDSEGVCNPLSSTGDSAGEVGWLRGGVGGISPVKETNTSIDLAMSLKASTAGRWKTSLSSAVKIDRGGVLGAELPLDDAGVCLIVGSGNDSGVGLVLECCEMFGVLFGKALLCLRANGFDDDMKSTKVRVEEG